MKVAGFAKKRARTMGQGAGEKVLQRGDLRPAPGSARCPGAADRGADAIQLMERAGAMIDFVNVFNDSVSVMWSVMQLGSRCVVLAGVDLGARDRARMGAGGGRCGGAASDTDALVRSAFWGKGFCLPPSEKKRARSAGHQGAKKNAVRAGRATRARLDVWKGAPV